MVLRRLTVPRADNFQVNLSVVLRFYRDAVHCMQRGLATRKLSVRLSVKRVDCDKMEENSVQSFLGNRMLGGTTPST